MWPCKFPPASGERQGDEVWAGSAGSRHRPATTAATARLFDSVRAVQDCAPFRPPATRMRPSRQPTEPAGRPAPCWPMPSAGPPTVASGGHAAVCVSGQIDEGRLPKARQLRADAAHPLSQTDEGRPADAICRARQRGPRRSGLGGRCATAREGVPADSPDPHREPLHGCLKQQQACPAPSVAATRQRPGVAAAAAAGMRPRPTSARGPHRRVAEPSRGGARLTRSRGRRI